MDEVPVAGGGHMGDEGPCAITTRVIVHHIVGVCLAKEGRRAWASLQICKLSHWMPAVWYTDLGEAVLQAYLARTGGQQQ